MTTMAAGMPPASVRTALQVNLHPLDTPHASLVLEHQLRCWSGQVDRVSLTVDTRQPRSGRYHDDRHAEQLERLLQLLERVANRFDVDVRHVDYSQSARERVRACFFGAEAECPERAFDGGPFHAYFHGILMAGAEYVLHVDSDMLFGGGSQSWVQEALELLRSVPSALFAGPLPGPPSAAGLLGAHDRFQGRAPAARPISWAVDPPAYRFTTVSTRVFLMDLARFRERVAALELVTPPLSYRLRARAFGESPLTMPAEEVLTAALVEHDLCRIDFLGRGRGMFSLHPPFRSPDFYRMLPRLIERIEAGEIPVEQRGYYDLNASMLGCAPPRRGTIRRAMRAVRHLARVRSAHGPRA